MITDTNETELKEKFGPDGPAKVRYLSTVIAVAGTDVLPSDLETFVRTEDLDTHRALAEFWSHKHETGEWLVSDPSRASSGDQARSLARVRSVERANAGINPDPEGTDASVIERVKHDPAEAVHATDDQLFQAISELWSDGQRTTARRLMFANSHRLDQERQNAILGGDPDRSITVNAAHERWDEQNPQEPDAAEVRRRNARSGNESSPGVTSVMETAPGSIQDRAAEEKAREAIERNRARENATDGDDVNMDLAPGAAKERFEARQKYDDADGGDE